MKRVLFGVLCFLALHVSPALGEGRLLSVYLESIASMQGQILQAAQLFEVPELGSAPMMLNMMVPGYAQVDRDEPVAVHAFIGEDGDYSVVVDVQPLDSAETLLGAVLANMGLTLPEPEDGRYMTDFGVAKKHGNRLLMAQDAEKLDMALRIGIPDEMPNIPGFLRMQMEPSRLLSFFDSIEPMMQEAMPEDSEQEQMFAQVMSLYRKLLEQVSSYQTGLGLQEDGLAIRSRILPMRGRALDQIVQSVQGVNPAWVASMEAPNIFSMASGSMDIPDHITDAMLDFYVGWMEQLPDEHSMDADLVRASFEPAMKMMGAASFTSVNVSEEGELRIQSGSVMDNASKILQQMIELTEREDYIDSMQESGMQMVGPDVRDVQGVDAYRWSMEFDEDAFLGNMEDLDEVPDEHVAIWIAIMEKLFSGYDYAAIDEGLVYSMPGDAQLTEAAELLRKASDEDPVEDSALLQRIGAPVMPYTIGRFDLLSLFNGMQSLGVPHIPHTDAEGEGIIFAGWREGDGVEQLLLIPASDIRVIRQMFSAIIPQ